MNASGEVDSPQLGRALLLWHQYGPVLDPVVAFNGQPYVDSDSGGSTLSHDGRQHYAEVKRAQLFASDNARAPAGADLAASPPRLQTQPPRIPPRTCGRCCWPACSRPWCSPPRRPTSR